MSFYEERVLPWLLHVVMKTDRLVVYRERVAGAASGRVLEVGMGSGLNLPFYCDRVTELIGLEPSAGLRRKIHGSRATIVAGSAEAIPLDTHSMDTIVSTWTLCSIPKVDIALAEIRRVLKPGGCFLFVEHGESPDQNVRRRQQSWTPRWKKAVGGCHLDRPIEKLIRDAGFEIESLAKGYAEGPRPLTYTYEGAARPV
jgi:ubiquinone/menaquinone biosynthesis C-methylase UbiE